MKRHNNDQVRELLENYGYQVINLPDDRRRNVIVFDAYSKKEMKIRLNQLQNHIERGRRKTKEEYYKGTNFYKFRQKFNLNDEFFTERNLANIVEDINKLSSKIERKKEFTYYVNNINDLVSFIYSVENMMPNLGKNLELTITNKDGVQHLVRVTRNTLGALLDIFDEHVDAVDSEGDIFRGRNDIRSVRIEFADRRLGNRRAGGFSHTGT